MPETALKIAIIGCGRQASKLLVVLEELSDLFEIAALCDIELAKAETLRAELGNPEIPIFSTIEEMSSVALDAVLIATPTYDHLRPARAALERGWHVMLEKPLALSLAEIDEFIEFALHCPQVVQIEFPLINSSIATIINNFTSQHECKYINMYEHREPFYGEWFFESSKSGGAINDKLIHFFDISNHTFKSRATSVYASGGQHFYHQGMSIRRMTEETFEVSHPDIADHASVIVNYENGAQLNISMVMYQGRPSEGLHIGLSAIDGNFINIDVEGTQIFYTELNEKRDLITRELDSAHETDKLYINHPGTKRELQNFAMHIKRGTKPVANLFSAREAQIIAFAAEQSYKTGQPVTMRQYHNPRLEASLQSSDHYAKPMTDAVELQFKEPEPEHDDWLDLIYKRLRKLVPEVEGVRPLSFDDLDLVAKRLNDKYAQKQIFTPLTGKLCWLNLPSLSFGLVVEDTQVKLIKAPTQSSPDFEITLTETGYQGLFGGKALAWLALNGDIALKGELKFLQENGHSLKPLLEELIEYLHTN